MMYTTSALQLFLLLLLISAASGQVWSPIQCVPLDLATEDLFQNVKLIDRFESRQINWAPARSGQCAQTELHWDQQQGQSGGASMRVDYRFIGKPELEYIQIAGKASVAQGGFGIGFWLRHDGTPFSLRLRIIDAGGENHQLELQGSTDAGWQFVAGLLDNPSSCWGGDGNGRVDYPCRLSGLVFDRPQNGFVGSGSLWIDDVAIVKQREIEPRPLEVESQHNPFGNLFAVGQTVALRASGEGRHIQWSVVDFFGSQVAEGRGPASGSQIEFSLSHPGWYSCQLRLIEDDVTVNSQSYFCAALPGGAESTRSDFAGVCCHFGQNRYPLDAMDLMLRYGIDQYRDEIGWQGYERHKGRYALPKHAADFLARSASLRMRPLLIFDYSNSHYDDGGYPNSPEAIAGFAAYAVDLARQTRSTVSMFEIWNEWIGGCGMKDKPGRHDGDAYGRLLKPTYTAVKSAFPEATLVGIGGEYGEQCADNILAAVRAAGPDAMDAWSIHPYRYPRSPESSKLVDEVTAIATQVAAGGVKTKAWVTEIGYPTHRTSRGSSLVAQARHCVRTFVLLQSTGVVEKVFWYDLKDDGLSRNYNEHNFGLVHHQRYNCAPKPGIVALSVFVRMTGGAEFQGLQQSGDTFIARYRQVDDRDVTIAWTSQGSATLRLDCPTATYNMMGAAQAVSSEIELTEAPVYMVGKGLMKGKQSAATR